METFITIVLYTLIVIFDFMPIVKEKQKTEKWVYLTILSLTFCVLILVIFNVPVPGPSELIKTTVKMVFHVQ